MDPEMILEPNQRICDPHHHLWEHPGSLYVMEQLRSDTSGSAVASTVFVECGSSYRPDGPQALRPVGETQWVTALGAREGWGVEGIVGFADLSLGGSVQEVLEAHISAGQGRFRGIRHVSAWDASPSIRASHTNPAPELMRRPEFRAGFARLAGVGLSFDAWLYFPQLPELIELADAFPETTIILDHLGGPLGIGPYAGQRQSVLETWRSSMAGLSERANVVVKLGGVGMPIYGMDWHRRPEPPSSAEVARVWGGPIRWVIDSFGPDRCMFESNFPVDRASFDYATAWNTFHRIAADYSESERASLFHHTAARVYRLAA